MSDSEPEEFYNHMRIPIISAMIKNPHIKQEKQNSTINRLVPHISEEELELLAKNGSDWGLSFKDINTGKELTSKEIFDKLMSEEDQEKLDITCRKATKNISMEKLTRSGIISVEKSKRISPYMEIFGALFSKNANDIKGPTSLFLAAFKDEEEVLIEPTKIYAFVYYDYSIDEWRGTFGSFAFVYGIYFGMNIYEEVKNHAFLELKDGYPYLLIFQAVSSFSNNINTNTSTSKNSDTVYKKLTKLYLENNKSDVKPLIWDQLIILT